MATPGHLAAPPPVNYQAMMTDKILKIAAWGLLAAIVVVTIVPLELRPTDVATADIDRAFAFMIVTAVFTLAFPRKIWLCVLLLMAAVWFIESLQFLSVSRHPDASDAVWKTLGVAAGAAAGWLVNCLRMKRA
jgi:hypothetical protein